MSQLGKQVLRPPSAKSGGSACIHVSVSKGSWELLQLPHGAALGLWGVGVGKELQEKAQRCCHLLSYRGGQKHGAQRGSGQGAILTDLG